MTLQQQINQVSEQINQLAKQWPNTPIDERDQLMDEIRDLRTQKEQLMLKIAEQTH